MLVYNNGLKQEMLFQFVPEMAGGLPTPRAAAEIQADKTASDVLNGQAKVITCHGENVTGEYLNGAEQALSLVKQHRIKAAILKARSPSCGSKQIYDGSYSRSLVDGMGITAALLASYGVRVFDESEIDQALQSC